MAKRILVAPGVRGIEVGGRLVLKSGDEAVISDAEFAGLSALVSQGLVVDLGTTSAPESVAPGVTVADQASSAAYIRSLLSARADAEALAALRRFSGQAAIDYADATVTTWDWAALPAVQTNQQVSGNKMYSNGTLTNAGAFIPLPTAITAGQKFHISTFFDIVALGGSSYTFLGLSFTATDSTTQNAADTVGYGVSASGKIQAIVGGNVTGTTTKPADTASGVVPAGRYLATIDGDEQHISFAIRSTTDHTRQWTWNFPTSVLTSNAKTIGRVYLGQADTRALTGHSIGPVTIVQGSQQPSRTKVLGGHTVEGIAHRDVSRVAVSSSDLWRYQVPASYDPRRPAPLAIYLHQAQSSVATVDRPWSHANEQPLTKALGDAGYLVAAAQDGHVVGNANSDRYGNAVSMANYLDLYRFLRSHFAISSVVLYGPSMAGITGANLISRRVIPNVAAAYFINSTMDLGAGYEVPQYQPAIGAAYGVTEQNPFISASEGFRPEDREGWEFDGVPIRVVVADSDDVAVPGAADAFLGKVAPYAAEASKFEVAGEHLGAASFSAGDLMTFLGRHVQV